MHFSVQDLLASVVHSLGTVRFNYCEKARAEDTLMKRATPHSGGLLRGYHAEVFRLGEGLSGMQLELINPPWADVNVLSQKILI